MAMQHTRQAPGRDIHKHFSLAPARSHTITASSKASATAATRNPPPHPDPYKTGPKLAKRRRGHHTCHSTLSLPPAHLPPRSSHTLPHTSNHERAQTVKGGETPPACAPPLSGASASSTATATATATRSLAPSQAPHKPLHEPHRLYPSEVATDHAHLAHVPDTGNRGDASANVAEHPVRTRGSPRMSVLTVPGRGPWLRARVPARIGAAAVPCRTKQLRRVVACARADAVGRGVALGGLMSDDTKETAVWRSKRQRGTEMRSPGAESAREPGRPSLGNHRPRERRRR